MNIVWESSKTNGDSENVSFVLYKGIIYHKNKVYITPCLNPSIIQFISCTLYMYIHIYWFMQYNICTGVCMYTPFDTRHKVVLNFFSANCVASLVIYNPRDYSLFTK